MTDRIDTAAIRARVAAATPGPWQVWAGRLSIFANVSEETPGSICGDPVCEVEMYRCSDRDPDPDDTECGCDEEGCKTCRPVQHADADLIAHAPSDLAALCDEVERLREIIAGRTTPPTYAEADAHPGAFLWMRMDRGEAIAITREGCEREGFDSIAFGFVWFREDLDDELPRAVGGRWWALDASGAPCAWPVVTKEVE